MTQQVINVGSTANDGTGDPLRTALQKANSNFTELYSKKIQQLTINSSTPTDIDLTADIVQITTDGTGVPNLLNVPPITPDASGIGDAALAGHLILVQLVALTNPTDTVVISLDGSLSIEANTLVFNSIPAIRTISGVILDSVGSASAFTCLYDYVGWTPDYSDYDDSTPSQTGTPAFLGGASNIDNPAAAGGQASLQGGESSQVGQPGGAINITAGSQEVGGAAGGTITIQAGFVTAGDGDGGDLELSAGLGQGTGRTGYILVSNLPTSDPGQQGALWNNAGVLSISL